MESGYKVFWTDHALTELSNTFSYLEENFSNTEIRKLAFEIERTISLISQNPNLFPLSKYIGLRKANILSFNSMYYKVANNEIAIISFFSNRQSLPKF